MLEEQRVLLVIGDDLLILVQYLFLLLEDGAGEPFVVLVLLYLRGKGCLELGFDAFESDLVKVFY